MYSNGSDDYGQEVPLIYLFPPIRWLAERVRANRAIRARRSRDRRPAVDAVGSLADVRRCPIVGHRGEVLEGPQVMAPFAGKPVVGFHLLLEARSHALGPLWFPLLDETYVQPFELSGGPKNQKVGAVRVSPGRSARLDLPPAPPIHLDALDVAARDHFSGYLARAGVRTTELISLVALRVTERHVEPGHVIRVVGAPRVVAEKRLELVPPPGGELWIDGDRLPPFDKSTSDAVSA